MTAAPDTVPRYETREAILVVLAVFLQLALWQALRWLGLQVHGEVVGTPLPEWYGFVNAPLVRFISVAPAFLVGFFAIRYGVALGVLAAVLAAIAGLGFPTLPGVWAGWSVSTLLHWSISSLLSVALSAAILGGVAAAGGAYFARRARTGSTVESNETSARELR